MNGCTNAGCVALAAAGVGTMKRPALARSLIGSIAPAAIDGTELDVKSACPPPGLRKSLNLNVANDSGLTTHDPSSTPILRCVSKPVPVCGPWIEVNWLLVSTSWDVR